MDSWSCRRGDASRQRNSRTRLGKSLPGQERRDHHVLRRRFSFRVNVRCRAKDGLQECVLAHWRLQGARCCELADEVWRVNSQRAPNGFLTRLFAELNFPAPWEAAARLTFAPALPNGLKVN